MWTLGGRSFSSHLLLGTARFASPEQMRAAIVGSGSEIVTVSLRRQAPSVHGGKAFWDLLRECKVAILPNTAGCRSAKEAITTARLARDLFDTSWIKLEVIGDEFTLQPDPFGLVEAAEQLCREGFEVFPYTTDDIVVAERLVGVGCKILMPWGAPIGSGRGLANPTALKTFRARFKRVACIVDAGIGKPSHATQAMEMGFDGVLLNTAVAQAQDPVQMATAFRLAVEAGYTGYAAGVMPAREMAVPSTPVIGTPFWHEGAAR